MLPRTGKGDRSEATLEILKAKNKARRRRGSHPDADEGSFDPDIVSGVGPSSL